MSSTRCHRRTGTPRRASTSSRAALGGRWRSRPARLPGSPSEMIGRAGGARPYAPRVEGEAVRKRIAKTALVTLGTILVATSGAQAAVVRVDQAGYEAGRPA